MNEKHTPEPWHQGVYDNPKRLALAIFSEGQDEVAVCDTVETALRIVACVNACKGIDTARLEENASDPVAGLFGRMAAKLEIENRTLTAQRDELLAALTHAATDYIDQNGMVPSWWTDKIRQMVKDMPHA